MRMRNPVRPAPSAERIVTLRMPVLLAPQNSTPTAPGLPAPVSMVTLRSALPELRLFECPFPYARTGF